MVGSLIFAPTFLFEVDLVHVVVNMKLLLQIQFFEKREIIVYLMVLLMMVTPGGNNTRPCGLHKFLNQSFTPQQFCFRAAKFIMRQLASVYTAKTIYRVWLKITSVPLQASGNFGPIMGKHNCFGSFSNDA